jgi:hypothetical protein
MAGGWKIPEKLPNCQATFIPNTGHFRIFEHMGDMLDVLVPPAGISELK